MITHPTDASASPGPDEGVRDTHWLTRYDPEDGEPYGTMCDCEIGCDHNGYGELTIL